jgi:hypothetical protein
VEVSPDGCLVECGRDDSEQDNEDYNELHPGQEQHSQHLDLCTTDTARLTTPRTNTLLHHSRQYLNSPPAMEQRKRINYAPYLSY